MRALILVLVIGGVCVLTFAITARLSSTYILVHEGMALRCDYILGNVDYAELAGYFAEDSLSGDARLRENYTGFNIADRDYTLTIEKQRVYPWHASPHIIAIEQVRGIRGAASSDESASAPPEWTTLRYRISLDQRNGRWYIIGLTVLEIDPASPPAATPDPERAPIPMVTPSESAM